MVKSFGRETYEMRRYGTAMEKTLSPALQMAIYIVAWVNHDVSGV